MGNSLLPRNPGRPTFASLVVRAAGDQWLLLGALFMGGAGWGVGIPALAAGGVAVVCLGVGAVLKVFTGDVAPRERKELAGPGRETQAGELMQDLDYYLGELTALREAKTPDIVTDATVEALVAAQDARDNAAKAASAVQALDNALERSQAAHTRAGGRAEGVAQAEARMRQRREQLLGTLNTAVMEIAEVYTKLLELSATAGINSNGDADGSVAQVNDSLDSLRTALGELEGSTKGDDLAV